MTDRSTQTEPIDRQTVLGDPADGLEDLRQSEAKARVIRVGSQPADDFLLDDREKAAIELINCNLARALNITEEEKSELIAKISSLKKKLRESEEEMKSLQKQRDVFESSVDLLKVGYANPVQSQTARR